MMKSSLLTAGLLSVSSLLLSQVALAQSYQSISSVGYAKADYLNSETKTTSLSSRYYFEAKDVLGPLNRFSYINSVSNVSVNYLNRDFNNKEAWGALSESDSLAVSGEWFSGNFLVGGGAAYHDNKYQDALTTGGGTDSFNSYQLSLGYLISPDFLLKVNGHKVENQDEYFTFEAKYNMQLNQSDYLGFHYATDENFDFHNLSSEYFMAMGSDRYLVVGGQYMYDNSDNAFSNDSWVINSEFYFSANTSIMASYGKDDFYSLGASHFFNENYSVSLHYSDRKDEDNFENIGASFTLSF